MCSLSVSTHNTSCHSFLPLAAADPLADHDVQAGLRSAVLRRGGGCRPGQGQHAGHRPQTVLRPVRPAGERTEGRLHSSRSEGAVPGVREHLSRTPYPTRPWGLKLSFSWNAETFCYYSAKFMLRIWAFSEENLQPLWGTCSLWTECFSRAEAWWTSGFYHRTGNKGKLLLRSPLCVCGGITPPFLWKTDVILLLACSHPFVTSRNVIFTCHFLTITPTCIWRAHSVPVAPPRSRTHSKHWSRDSEGIKFFTC